MGCGASKTKADKPLEGKKELTHINETVDKIIEKMWAEYDKDNNGSLDQEEVKLLTIATLKKIKGDDFVPPTDEEMTTAFNEFDKDGNKKVEKSEMFSYLRK